MAQQTIGFTRQAQRTAGAISNANFTELYALTNVVPKLASAAAGTFVVPAGHMLVGIHFVNNTAAAVTGGVKVGTTVGGADVVTAQAVAASATGSAVDSAILKALFSKTVYTTIYFDAVTNWSTTNVDLFFVTRKLY